MQATKGSASRKEVIRNVKHILIPLLIAAIIAAFLLLHHNGGNHVPRSDPHWRAAALAILQAPGTAIIDQAHKNEAAQAAAEAARAKAALDAQRRAEILTSQSQPSSSSSSALASSASSATSSGGSSCPGKYGCQWWPAIEEAAAQYGQSPQALYRVMICESTGNANADNGICKGLFQFNPRTWASTPYGRESIWNGRAQAFAAAWMWASGRKSEWSCQ